MSTWRTALHLHLQDGGKTLTRLTQQFKRMLPSGKGGLSSANAAEAAQDGSAPQRKGVGRLKARFLSKEPATVDIRPSSFDYETSMGFPEVTSAPSLQPLLLSVDEASCCL